MAKKTAPPPTQRPSSSSSEDSSSDEEQSNNAKPDPQQAPTKNDGESESESDTEEESPDEDGDEKPQTVNSTPSKLPPKPEPEKIVTPSKPISEKSNRKSPFKRLWSLDDEIAILEAMVDHKSRNGPIKISIAGVKGFHDSIRKSLSIDVDTTKLTEKMRKMWKKYIDADKKGDRRKLANAHDKTFYKLGEKVWGKVKEEVGFVEKPLDGDSSGVTVNKGKNLKREFPFIRDALGGNRLALEMLENADVKEAMVLENKFKKLKFAEINLIRKAYKVLCDESGKVMN